ncbi:transcription antitermination factor NusB [Corynebacterium amycolatum SK46]|nr:transcription antitermination factor NusB [Corynebacterium amycolatum]EEB62608.1 transcription antitermination factor NusB [Corynebacterium amycolatum SK46]
MTEKDHKSAETSDAHESAKVREPNYKRHGARYRARRRAVDLLFEAEQRGVDVVKLLEERLEMVRNPDLDVNPIAEYTEQIVRGVAAEIIGIDSTISSYLTEEWPLRRLPAVDRAILRLSTWELFYNSDVPPRVAVVEGVELASEYSTDVAAPYINAVLDAEAKIADQARLAAAAVSTSVGESQFDEAIQAQAAANEEADKALADSDEMAKITGLDMSDIAKLVAEDVAKSDNGS